MGRQAARHGKHVLCEKPLALTAADCRELEAVFKEKRVRLMEAFMYRFLPGMKALKEILERGDIGEICHIYSTHRFFLQDDGDVPGKPGARRWFAAGRGVLSGKPDRMAVK